MFSFTLSLGVLYFVCVFVFFKQKTAYEMRISDWSSDVCSSDLFDRLRQAGAVSVCAPGIAGVCAAPWSGAGRAALARRRCARHRRRGIGRLHRRVVAAMDRRGPQAHGAQGIAGHDLAQRLCRSEEHTSELQSLMRISYAVFCLKKNKN